MAETRTRHDTIPDVIEITLYYWDTCKWTINEEQSKPVRFRIIGKAMGPARWQPHLVQYKDALPIQGKKDLNIMLETLQSSISTKLNLDCIFITKDLLDDISRVLE